MTVLLVCGSRDWTDDHHIYETLDELDTMFAGFAELVHGGATGADTLAAEWAMSRKVPVSVHVPDYDRHGTRAPLERNMEMLERHRPAVVVAFKGRLSPGLRRGGTEHMIRKALEAEWCPDVFVFRGDPS